MIAEKQPDLIITITEADYDKYSQIAPTIYIEDGKRTDEELFLYIADILGKKDEAQAYLDDFSQKVADTKDEINQIVGDRTVSIVEVWPQQVYVMGDKFARGGSSSSTCGASRLPRRWRRSSSREISSTT